MMLRSLLPAVVVLSLLTLITCPVYAEDENTQTIKPLKLEDTRPEKLPKEGPVKSTGEVRKLAQDDLMREKSATRSGDLRPKPATGAGNLRDKPASRGAMLKDKLATFKDKRKATVVERIVTNLTNVNQRRTSQMLQHIDVLMGIQTKAEDRVTVAQAAGGDMTVVLTELNLSKTALANAKTAVEQQSKKTYELQIATESGVKLEAKEMRDLLGQDLKSTHSLVKEARRVLINALMKLGQSMGGGQTQTNESN